MLVLTHVVLAVTGVYTATAGIFFSYKLGRLYGVRYAVGPYLYLWSTFWLTQKLAPVKWGKVIGRVRAAFAEYRSALSRLFVNQEAVSALKGPIVEDRIIAQRFDKLLTETATFNSVSIWHGFVNQLGFHWWLRSFVALFVIGPHVFYPSVTDLSSLENIAKLRGNVGHEFVLFIQVFQSGHEDAPYALLTPRSTIC